MGMFEVVVIVASVIASMVELAIHGDQRPENGAVAKRLTRRSAKPPIEGSNPSRTSTIDGAPAGLTEGVTWW